jgi:radical SAM protein with 4Fe4S-binding SPASM domain
VESLSYGEFSQNLHQQALTSRIPLNGAIEVTYRCPLECRHCYNNLPMNDPEARRGELSYDEHCRILDEIGDAGCLWLLYTGGEIFARPDFLDIYTYAKKKGMLITLFTNGTLITPEVADHLAEWRPFRIETTLYGCTRETYESVTRIPGSFDRCMRGIRLLQERELPLALKSMVMSLNKHEIWDLKRFVERDFGCEFRFDAMLNARIDCTQGPLAVRLTPVEVVELDVLDPKRMMEWERFCRQFNGPVHSPDGDDEMYHCGAGINAFTIDPQGRMSICLLAYDDPYNLRAGSFREGWQDHLQRVRRRKITRTTRCRSCAIQAMCGMCPANGTLENQDPEMPVDFLCEVAHLRSRALGIAVAAHGDCDYCRGNESDRI